MVVIKMYRKNIQNQISRIGQHVGISREEALSALQTRRHKIITIAIMAIATFAIIVGPIPLKYGGVSIQDFHWQWLF